MTLPLIRQHKKYHDCVDFQSLEKPSMTVEQAERANCLFVDKNIANRIKAILESECLIVNRTIKNYSADEN